MTDRLAHQRADKYSLGIYTEGVFLDPTGSKRMSGPNQGGLSNLEYHVLLAMAKGPLYGYAIKDRVESESAGSLTPRAGSLYRVLARLMTSGLVQETEAAEEVSPHPGRERKYYGLTRGGRGALGAEARRLKGAAALAEERLGIVEGHS